MRQFDDEFKHEVLRRSAEQIGIQTLDRICRLLRRPRIMKLTNDSYKILIGTKNFTERYYRDKDGWLKVSTRGRKFRMTAEQVLNHLLPALARVKPNLTVKVEHRAPASSE
jgi:hypothetical protein